MINGNASRPRLNQGRTLVSLTHLGFLGLLWVAAPPVRGQAPVAPESPALLTNAQQIAALGTNIPAGRYEARFKAVVLYVSPPTRRLYVQDGDLGVQVN